MAGVSKGQFSNDDFIYVSRWSFVAFERRFCFQQPNTKRSTDFFKSKKQIRFYFSDAKVLLPNSGGTGLREYKRA